jgi:hypothetical protein
MASTILTLAIVAVMVGYLVHRLVARRRTWVAVVDAEGVHHLIPRAPHAVRGAKANEYFTTATMAEVRAYHHRTLPAAGWAFVDASHEGLVITLVFARDDKRLHCLIESDVNPMRGRSRTRMTFTIAVHITPSHLERDSAAITALAKAGNREAVEPLIGLLADGRARVRREAVAALTVIKDERALQPLIHRLEDDDTGVRQHAAFALGEAGSKEAAEALIAGLKSDDGDFQTICAYALGKIKDHRAVQPLIAALEATPYAKVKTHAAMALGEIGDRSSVQPLTACLKDIDQNVRAMATVSLMKLLSAAEFSALVQEMQNQADRHSIEDSSKNAVAENVAKVATDIVFDLLGIRH